MFCGAGALTREDAWPRWLVERFNAHERVVVEAERGGQSLGRWRQAGHHTKVKFVCAPCNNGWMSVLENEAKPLIESLLDHRTSELSARHQHTLARWAVKSAMVFEALRGNRAWFYEPTERAAVRLGAVPAGFTKVWLGQCVDLPSIHCIGSDMSDTPDPIAASAKGYVTTLAFGILAIQVLTVRLSAGAPQVTRITTDLRPGPWEETVLQVWPPTENAQWPLALGLDGERGVEELSLRFRPVAAGESP
jgi:hypothetical protein